MTEQTRSEVPGTEQKRCIVGSSTDSPCPFPATEPDPKYADDTPEFCRYHAATEPIWREIDQLNLSLSLLRAYLKGARGHDAPMLVTVLERAESDFSERARVLGEGPGRPPGSRARVDAVTGPTYLPGRGYHWSRPYFEEGKWQE